MSPGARAGGRVPRATPLERLRAICLALTEAREAEAWGAPTFRVRDRLFAMYADAGNHHGAGREAVWCKASPANQDLLVRALPERYFVPPYVGPSGWVGVYLDARPDWDAVTELVTDGYRMLAPKRLLAELERRAYP